jgi:hypothetical protein
MFYQGNLTEGEGLSRVDLLLKTNNFRSGALEIANTIYFFPKQAN